VDETHDNSDEFSAVGSDWAFSEPPDRPDSVGADPWSENEPEESVHLPIRFLGDEPELYLEFNRQLVARVSNAVIAPREDVEDACAFAWVQFFRYQPDRDQNWHGWLFRTAQREAWRLTAIRNRDWPLMSTAQDREQPDLDLAVRLQFRENFADAMSELKQLPKSMREVVFVASQVRKHRDVGEILNMPESRVGYLLASAAAALREAAERRTECDRPVASPRAARLRELEDAPPEWLIEVVGRPPTRDKNASASILAWRRAALAIDDYRHDHGWSSPYEGLGPRPTDDLVARRAHERAQQAVERVSAERARRRGDSRER
jgi:DNA-directed RNA polymerase specialized sigma24 family protein